MISERGGIPQLASRSAGKARRHPGGPPGSREEGRQREGARGEARRGDETRALTHGVDGELHMLDGAAEVVGV